MKRLDLSRRHADPVGLPVVVARQAQAIAILSLAVAVNVASDVFVLGLVRGWWS